MAKKEKSCAFRTSIGGQALIEGILMRGPKKQAIVCRKADGELSVQVSELKFVKDRYPILGWPFIRGVANFLDSMVKGMQAITWSAEQQPEELQEEPSKFDLWLEKKLGNEKAEKIVLGCAVALGIMLAIGLFFFLPTLLTGLFDSALHSRLLRNLIEGIIRICIFLLYLWAVTRMKEIQRMFAYHGAEHKTIHCYEKGLPLTVENVRTQPKEHPRCGTSFLFVVMIVSVLVLMFVNWTTPLMRLVIRLCLLPLIVAISYEFNRLVGRHDNVLTSILSWPGRQLQHLTTFEPDDSMIECAIESIKLVIPEEEGADKW